MTKASRKSRPRKSVRKPSTKSNGTGDGSDTTVAASQVQEVDLTDASKFGASAARLVANLDIAPRFELKNVNVGVLAPPAPEDVPGSPPEPVYTSKEQEDIQGNVIPGFNKDHQHFLFYRIRNVRSCKRFLQWVAPQITSMEEVIAFRRLYRARRLKLGRAKINLCSTWVNIGFSHGAIARLHGKAEANAFGDHSFRQGLAERSSYLGDPTAKSSSGHPSRWLVGGPKNEADIILIVASDEVHTLEDLIAEIDGRARGDGLELMFEQRGATLPGTLRGHEHFGFRDGISQPGVRGKLSTSPGDYITPRYIEHSDPRRLYMAKPGQFLAWPGQFLLGEERQSTEDHINSAAGATNFPEWAKHGSYLVVRRLRQDVLAFWRLVNAIAARLSMNPTKVASMLVGRWPSGAPIMRVPLADNPTLGGDEFANNHFIFEDDTRPVGLLPISGYPGDPFPRAAADFLAQVCPHFAHIRKVNPRDAATEMGKPEDSITHMVLRRGIPFGQPLIRRKRPSPGVRRADRGLMFLCYAATIEDQFEFLQRRWSNSTVQPNVDGHDSIIGQNGRQGSRVRVIDFPTATGPVRFKIKEESVVPTGGGYFFSPVISAVSNVLAA